MPTLRPRYTVTETDELGRALDAAARVWPEDRDDRGALLRHILARGADDVESEASGTLARRRAALDALSGSFTGAYPPGERARLRDEWPE